MGCAIGLALEYFRCLACGCVWLDDPRCPEAWRCPSCGCVERIERVSGQGGRR